MLRLSFSDKLNSDTFCDVYSENNVSQEHNVWLNLYQMVSLFGSFCTAYYLALASWRSSQKSIVLYFILLTFKHEVTHYAAYIESGKVAMVTHNH